MLVKSNRGKDSAVTQNREISGDEMTRGTTARPGIQKPAAAKAPEATAGVTDPVDNSPVAIAAATAGPIPTPADGPVAPVTERIPAASQSLVDEMMDDNQRSLERAFAEDGTDDSGRLALDTKVWYAMDQDGIVEFLPARVIDTEPRPGGFKLPAPIFGSAVHLAVKMSPRHNANLPEVTRIDVEPAPDADVIGAGYYYRAKPSGADEEFKRLMTRRGIGEENSREAARTAAGAKRAAAGQPERD